MSSPNLYIAVCDFPSLLQNPDGKYEKVERGSLLTLTSAPPSHLSRTDSTLFHSPILWLRVNESEKVVGVDPESVKEIGPLVWRILLAVTDTEERYAFYMDHKRLREVMQLKTGDHVRVQVKSSSGRKERGVLRYMGSVNQEQEIFFGVQLMGHAMGKGFTDGSFRGQRFFHCDENCGVFVSGSKLERDWAEYPVRKAGRIDEKTPGGHEESALRSRNCQEPRTKPLVFMSRGVRQESPQRTGEKDPENAEDDPQPLTSPIEGEEAQNLNQPSEDHPPSSLYCPPRNPSPSSPSAQDEALSKGLEPNSMVEVNDPPIYGVIRWIGHIPDCPEPIAGLEMEEEHLSAYTDGTFRGVRYFQCGSNKALFVKLRNCRPDSRFYSLHGPSNPIQRCNSIAFRDYTSKCVEENTPPATDSEAVECLIGWKKGIQGHCNSCYLDATLFWLTCAVVTQGITPHSTVIVTGDESRVFKLQDAVVTKNFMLKMFVRWSKSHKIMLPELVRCCPNWYNERNMFACSSALDTILLRPPDKNDSDSYIDTRDLLRTEIVNPLRKNGYVCATKIMTLRKILEAAGKSAGFTNEEKGLQYLIRRLRPLPGPVTSIGDLAFLQLRPIQVNGIELQCKQLIGTGAENWTPTNQILMTYPEDKPLIYNFWSKRIKLPCALPETRHLQTEKNPNSDPEEFLNRLFQVLRVEPLFYIRTPKKKPQGCIFYQIFMEKKQSVEVPSVQQLLEWSMVTGDLKFTEVPSCLIIQMPRNGKNFKMFNTIFPTQQLDITDLLEDTPRQCSVCQSLAVVECLDCYEDLGITPGQIKQYCSICNKQVHLHRQRCGHQPRNLSLPENLNGQAVLQRQSLQLYAVLCIETSHYVAFIRMNSDSRPLWVFFDSMADREGGQNGFNIPRVTLCPEVTEYLEMTAEELQREDPKTMPVYARRLLCDAYMCLYYSPDLSLYK